MDFLNSAEGESLKSFFLNLASYERKSIIARYGTWAAALADQDYGHTEREVGSHRLCDLLNALSRAIIGPTYRYLFHWAGKLTLDARPFRCARTDPSLTLLPPAGMDGHYHSTASSPYQR
jgi:hypothetical protein